MKPSWIAAVAAACALLASACSKTEPEMAPASPTAPSAPAMAAKQAAIKAAAQTYPRVEISTEAGLFWFEPRRCSVGPDADSGVVSYSIEGAGQSPDGQPVYVTLEDEDDDPAQGPEMRINVGTDQPLKTPEVVWIANDAGAHSLNIPAAKATIEDKRVTVNGLVFTRSGTDRLAATSAIEVLCAKRT